MERFFSGKHLNKRCPQSCVVENIGSKIKESSSKEQVHDIQLGGRGVKEKDIFWVKVYLTKTGEETRSLTQEQLESSYVEPTSVGEQEISKRGNLGKKDLAPMQTVITSRVSASPSDSITETNIVQKTP